MFYKLIEVKMNTNSLWLVYFHLMQPQFTPSSARGGKANPLRFEKQTEKQSSLLGPA